MSVQTDVSEVLAACFVPVNLEDRNLLLSSGILYHCSLPENTSPYNGNSKVQVTWHCYIPESSRLHSRRGDYDGESLVRRETLRGARPGPRMP